MSEQEIYLEWFKKADDDEKAANVIFIDGSIFSVVCFLCHQAAEKYLKGLLVFNKEKFPKTHDLIALADLLADKASDIKNIHEEIKPLNRYYIETRYPGDYPEFTKKEAREALES